MNGVLRFLGSATSSPKQQQPEALQPSLPSVVPLSFSSTPKQSSSPLTSNSPSPLHPESSPKSIPSLTINKKERLKQVSLSQSAISDDPSNLSPNSTPLKPALKTSTINYAVSSPQRSQTIPTSSASDMSSAYSSNSRISDPSWKGDSANLTTRDELLISLMASEAAIDCREFSVLGTEEFEELKKEYQVLSSRLVAMNRKLALETKIRDAALNLSRVNAAHRKVSKQTGEQLEAANNRVETAQKELWRISEKSNEVYRRLMEHRAGVLSYSLRNLEAKMTEDSEYNSWSRTTLTSSVSPFSIPPVSTTLRFDGAHLFAGHADTIVPRPKLSADAAIAELARVEEKLKEAKAKLAVASKKQVDMARELSMVRLEREEVETTLGMDLQAAEETIIALEKDIPLLEEVNSEVQRLRQEKGAWEVERAHLTELMGPSPGKEEIEAGISALRLMIQDFGIGPFPNEPSLLNLLNSVASHLEMMHAKLEDSLEAKAEWESMKERLEDGVRMELDKHVVLTRELEDARRERDAFRRNSPLLTKSSGQLRTPSVSLSSEDSDFNLSHITSVLQPLWAILPSPEARATKLGANSNNKNFRAGSPVHNNSSTTASSLSELDVRSLKTLYDSRHISSSPSGSSNSSEPFSIEAFAQRVQALINDDKALIERLIRFAQAHDLLKKNAERAQKLAQDGNAAMETYQKQVKTLEERNMSLSIQYSGMQEEIDRLQDAIERMTADKHELEGLAAEQADQVQQLTEANNTLSAKTLQLADDAAQVPEMVRRQMEGQLSELKKKLEAAESELLALKTSEQSQRLILLDELNTMQTENSNLMAQLRAAKR